MSPDEVAALLAGRGAWTYSRASGPGGQRRDHAETRAELTIRREDLEGIPEPVAERLAARLRLDARPLRLSSQTDRSRERTREIVRARLERRVADAMAPPAPPRRPTRPSRGATERRLAEKARRSQRKAQRRPPPGDD